MTAKYYAGIGSRKTPVEIQQLMTAIAERLAERGWILRSGGAWGADQAFEKGCDQWYHFHSTFNQTHKGPMPKEIFYERDVKDDTDSKTALSLAEKFHPAWNRVNAYSRRLHARNAFQILGRDLKTPVEIVVCWTPDGCRSHAHRAISTGGTGTAISIASDCGIPVANLYWPAARELIAKKLKINH